MVTADQRALRLQAAGGDISIAALGGRENVRASLLGSATGPAQPLLVRALLSDWQGGEDADAVIAAVGSQVDPLAYEELVDLVLASPGATDTLQRLLDEALQRFGHRDDERTAGMATIAIDTAVRLVIVFGRSPWQLFAALDSITGDEPAHLLIAVVRRLGVIYIHNAEGRTLVRQRLRALADVAEVAADVAFQSAYADLVDGLEADELATAEGKLRSARAGFGHALSLDDGRIDAKLYRAALDSIFGLVDGRPSAELETLAIEVRELALLRRAWGACGRLGWLGDPLDADREWWTISRAVAVAAHATAQPEWMEPSILLNQLAQALRAAATARLLGAVPTPGAAAVITPALRMPFVADSRRKALLRRWADELLTTEDDDLGQALRDVVDQDDPTRPADSISATLVRALGDQDIVNALNSEQQLRLLGRLETLASSVDTDNPQVRRALDDMRAGLRHNADYVAETRAAFDVVMTHTLRFLADRMNVQLSLARFAYLRDPAALEGALQEDYREWMAGNGLQGILDIEVSHVAAGRVDVRFAYGTDRIVTEVKRDVDPFAEQALAAYLNQAGAYQASNVRLGILLVLDVSDKSKGQGRSLEKSVWLTTKPSLAPDDLARHIVVVVVPGNRPRTPSKLKA